MRKSVLIMGIFLNAFWLSVMGDPTLNQNPIPASNNHIAQFLPRDVSVKSGPEMER